MSRKMQLRSALETAFGGVKALLKRRLRSDHAVTRARYFHANGFYPDLVHPKDLSEKVSWLKLHDRSPLHTRCADKIRARDYVAGRVGAECLVPALLITRDPRDVAPEIIPAARFVVKTNHDQGGVFICRDRDAFDWAGVRREVAARMKVNKYPEFRERQYRDIAPGILVEALVEGAAGAPSPQEIKINCFHGAPGFIQVVLDRFGDRRQVFLGPDWTRLPMRGRAAPLAGEPPRPPHLERMLRDAARLAAPFLFARVDFLYGEGAAGEGARHWFSEITFHPAAGLVRYRPPGMERAWGEMIDLARLADSHSLQRAALERDPG